MSINGLFIFRRDLRVEDNRGLHKIADELYKMKEENKASNASLYCIFVLDPKQINSKQNPYYSPSAMLFMLDSLLSLSSAIHLTILHGNPHEVIEAMIKKHKISVVGFNEDYTPYSRTRDKQIANVCKNNNVKLITSEDVMCNSPNRIKPYKVFTPYYNVAKRIRVDKPLSDANKINRLINKLNEPSIYVASLVKKVMEQIAKNSMDITQVQRGGRKAALQLIRSFDPSTYKNRDSLTYESSRLSPHLKFGTISVREVYYQIPNALFRKQLYWRDFYAQIAYHFEVFGKNYKGLVQWKNNKKHFVAWMEGKTGYDIVDACMMQLNTTGYMHNRGRMIVANFLTKILHIDWRLGERYFATRLTDYDPCNNNGGWQWSAGTGVDAQPYFRIFNPTTQQTEHDPDRQYIKRWLGKERIEHPLQPIVDYQVERKRALTLYSNS